MRPSVFSFLTLSLFLVTGCSRPKEGDNYTHVQAEDAAMNKAIATAKSTLTNFVNAFHAQNPGTGGFYIKKPYPVPAGGHEHMWIEVREEKNGVFKGAIANEAEETKEVKLGQVVSVNAADVSDWKYQDGAKMVGGYTIRYFVGKMSPKERAAFLKEAGFEL